MAEAGPRASWRRWLPVIVTFALALGVALSCVGRLTLTTDITRFMAPGSDPRAARIAQELSRSELSRTVVLLVRAEAAAGEGEAGEAALRLGRRAADLLAERLAASPEIAWVRTGIPEDQQRRVYELMWPRRLMAAHGPPAASPDAWVSARTTPAALEAAARRLRLELARPTGSMVKRGAAEDPLLLGLDRIRELSGAGAGRLRSAHGGFVTEDGEAVILLATRASAFDATAQRAVQTTLEAARSEVEGELGPLTLSQSGVGRFAIRAETAIRGDIARISLLGTLGVALMFWLVFRSPWTMLVAMLPMGLGVLAGTAMVTWVVGPVHGLTLAFGGVLVGIGIDYPVHLMSHVADAEGDGDGAAPEERIRAALRTVRPGLLLGAGTTLVGFVGLGWTSFPGLREIALFAATGVATSLAVTLWTVPALLPRRGAAGSHPALRRAAARWLGTLGRRRGRSLAVLAAALAIVAAGAGRVRFVDDPRALTEIDAELLAEDERVRAAVARMDAGQLVLATGPDDASALRANELVYARLWAAREAGEVGAFASIHPWLSSAGRQAAYAEAWRRAEAGGLGPRLAQAFEGEGFRAGAFTPFLERIRAPSPPPLDAAALRDAGLDDLVGSFRIAEPKDPERATTDPASPGQVSYVTYVRDVADPAGLGASLEALGPEVRFFDQHATMERAYAAHRRQGVELVAVGLLAVLAVLLMRYRSLGRAAAAFLPSLLAAATTLALLGISGVELHLLHLVSVLLVLSMGVDYGVFLAESRAQRAQATTVVSLGLACLSTIFAFGLLALSSNPALRAVGITTGLGVALSLLFAPLLASLLRDCAPAGLGGGARATTLVLLCSLAGGCSAGRSGGKPPEDAPSFAEAEYPGLVVDPALVDRSFVTRQRLRVRWPGGAREFQVAVQLEGEVLEVVGLAPWGPAFVLTQRGEAVDFESRLPPGVELPFPPRYVLQDFGRAFLFDALLPWGDTPPTPQMRAQVGEEWVEEEWRSGRLLRRSFWRADGAPAGRIELRYGEGMSGGVPPPVVTLDNGWFGYHIEVETLSYTPL